MTSMIFPIEAATPTGQLAAVSDNSLSTAGAGATSFAQMLVDGIDDASSKVLNADKLVRAFVLDDSIPVHQVTFALEQARLSLELMMQVRSRLVEGYQQIMNMQL